jgi:hypothetical protein
MAGAPSGIIDLTDSGIQAGDVIYLCTNYWAINTFGTFNLPFDDIYSKIDIDGEPSMTVAQYQANGFETEVEYFPAPDESGRGIYQIVIVRGYDFNTSLNGGVSDGQNSIYTSGTNSMPDAGTLNGAGGDGVLMFGVSFPGIASNQLSYSTGASGFELIDNYNYYLGGTIGSGQNITTNSAIKRTSWTAGYDVPIFIWDSGFGVIPESWKAIAITLNKT